MVLFRGTTPLLPAWERINIVTLCLKCLVLGRCTPNLLATHCMCYGVMSATGLLTAWETACSSLLWILPCRRKLLRSFMLPVRARFKIPTHIQCDNDTDILLVNFGDVCTYQIWWMVFLMGVCQAVHWPHHLQSQSHYSSHCLVSSLEPGSWSVL